MLSFRGLALECRKEDADLTDSEVEPVVEQAEDREEAYEEVEEAEEAYVDCGLMEPR